MIKRAIFNVVDDELDIHVCGKCKASFTDLSAYIEHKKARNCSKPTEQGEGENTVVLPVVPGTLKSGNKVVVELLDPVDVSSVITDRNVITDTEQDILGKIISFELRCYE